MGKSGSFILGAGESVVEFEGVASVSLDGKGRLVVPARYRELLAQSSDRLVVTADPMKCLMLYPLVEWMPIRAKLRGLSDLNLRTRSLKQVMLGYAQEFEFDSAGRILLSPDQRDFAGLDKGVKLVGQGNRIEIWDAARWAEQMEQAVLLAREEPPAELEGFTL